MQGRRRAKTGGIPIPPTQTQVRQDALLPARGMLRILASRERRRWPRIIRRHANAVPGGLSMSSIS
jgi:hypothetical protein